MWIQDRHQRIIRLRRPNLLRGWIRKTPLVLFFKVWKIRNLGWCQTISKALSLWRDQSQRGSLIQWKSIKFPNFRGLKRNDRKSHSNRQLRAIYESLFKRRSLMRISMKLLEDTANLQNWPQVLWFRTRRKAYPINHLLLAWNRFLPTLEIFQFHKQTQRILTNRNTEWRLLRLSNNLSQLRQEQNRLIIYEKRLNLLLFNTRLAQEIRRILTGLKFRIETLLQNK